MTRFSFRSLPLRSAPVARAGTAEAAPRDPIELAMGDEQASSSNELVGLLNGDFSTLVAVSPALRYQSVGGCPVPLRASVLRLVLFKLLGTGVFVGLTAAGSENPHVVKTCALAAAVNAVAVVHYMFILRIRMQAVNSKPLSAWMIGLGRETDPPAIERQVQNNAKKLFAQEMAVDSLRSGDWAITLVLMKICEHAIAEKAEPTGDAFMAPQYAALLQTVVVFLGSITNFFLNDLRAPTDSMRSCKNKWVGIGLGVFAYTTAMGIWVTTTINLLVEVGHPENKVSSAAREDAYVLWILSLAQVGYPITSVIQLIWNYTKTPTGKADPLLSLIKDISYGMLDSVNKGGLALFVALRATR